MQKQSDDGLCPESPIAKKAQIGQRLLRAADLILLLAELVGEFDQQSSVAAALVLR